MESYEENGVHFMVLQAKKLNVSNHSGSDPFEISNDKIIDVKENAGIFWSYPVGTMIVTFKSNTDATRPFNLHIHEMDRIYEDIELVRVLSSGEEVGIEKNQNEAVLESDASNKCIVKFIGTPEMKYYGVNIQFSIVDK